MTQKELLDFLKSKKKFLQQEFAIEKIGLFGSYARGDYTQNSDIDLVIVTSKKSFRNRYALKEYLEKRLQKDIDIGYLDSLRGFIRNNIKDEIIYV